MSIFGHDYQTTVSWLNSIEEARPQQFFKLKILNISTKVDFVLSLSGFALIERCLIYGRILEQNFKERLIKLSILQLVTCQE